jgi:hypothetical protein
MEVGEIWAYRDKPRTPGTPVQPVEVLQLGPPRSPKGVRIRWIEGEYAGLDSAILIPQPELGVARIFVPPGDSSGVRRPWLMNTRSSSDMNRSRRRSRQDMGTIVACAVPGLYRACRHRPTGGRAAQNRCSSRADGTRTHVRSVSGLVSVRRRRGIGGSPGG